MSCPRAFPVSLVSIASAAIFVCLVCLASPAQISHSEQVQVMPPLLRTTDPPSPDATASDLELRADDLRASKLFLDALDYYRAAMAKQPNCARLLNKVGITELQMQRYREARKSFEDSFRIDRKFADAYNNLGVVFYEERKYGAAIKQYRRAIGIDGNSASFFNNMGAAYFSKREFEQAVKAYHQALALDPDVFERSSRAGVQAQLPSPDDRAHYNYTVARLYAQMGLSDRSLEYLRKAMEEGYKDFKNVFKDQEFAGLRKDPRFAELIASKTPQITD
jgi:tetratricopeptide (TPR) repeat protein